MIGAVAGTLITLAAAVVMDVVLADALQGTWRDAAAKDVMRMFGPACGRTNRGLTSSISRPVGGYPCAG